MATPYVVGLTIQYPAGTNLANVNVTLRVESTNESYTQTTNSSGEAVFNLGNKNQFPSGYKIGDVFSWVVLYSGYEAYGSHTISSGEGGFTKTIVLTATPTAPTLKLFKPQEFLDYFNMKIYEDDQENGVKMQQLVKIGEMVERSIENDADTKFDDNNGNYYSATEHIDTDEFQQVYHVKHTPVISVNNLYTTQNDQETTPDYPNNTTGWNSLTEGTDYVIDLETGRIQIVNESYFPISRRWGLYVDYKYGRSSVPADIKELAIIETGLRLFGANFIKSKIAKFSDVSVGDLSWFAEYRNRIIGNYRSSEILNT
jgi:hypothetical protein